MAIYTTAEFTTLQYGTQYISLDKQFEDSILTGVSKR